MVYHIISKGDSSCVLSQVLQTETPSKLLAISRDVCYGADALLSVNLGGPNVVIMQKLTSGHVGTCF